MWVINTLSSLLCSILDDFDLFEKQRSFKNEDLAEITMFLNNLLFRTIWEEKELSQFSHCQGLLLMLYNRDCKKHFCRKEHWILQLVAIFVHVVCVGFSNIILY